MWFCVAAWLAARLLRPHSARLRLWIWRIAMLKFALPFWLLFALGAWLGFPVSNPPDQAPAALLDALHAMAPIVAPAQSAHLAGAALVVGLLAMLPATLLCARMVCRGLRLERWLAHDEACRITTEPASAPPSPGFLRAALFTAVAFILLALPMLAGAVDDRAWRHELLVADARALRGAPIQMTPAAPGMGQRTRVLAFVDGVLVRNTSIQDLVAIAYGVNHYSVWTDQMFSEDSEPEDKYWLSLPRYDVRVRAPIQEPEKFDPYALRQAVTQLLARRFGLEISVQGKCQPPCGKYAVPMPEGAL